MPARLFVSAILAFMAHVPVHASIHSKTEAFWRRGFCNDIDNENIMGQELSIK